MGVTPAFAQGGKSGAPSPFRCRSYFKRTDKRAPVNFSAAGGFFSRSSSGMAARRSVTRRPPRLCEVSGPNVAVSYPARGYRVNTAKFKNPPRPPRVYRPYRGCDRAPRPQRSANSRRASAVKFWNRATGDTAIPKRTPSRLRGRSVNSRCAPAGG